MFVAVCIEERAGWSQKLQILTDLNKASAKWVEFELGRVKGPIGHSRLTLGLEVGSIIKTATFDVLHCYNLLWFFVNSGATMVRKSLPLRSAVPLL